MERDISKLYQDFILRKNQDPTGYEKRPLAQHLIEAYNPLCGDKFKLFLDINEGIITAASYHGYGCAISKAATVVLIQKIQNQTIKQALAITESYFEVLNTEGVAITTEDEDLKAFEVIRQFPERTTCANLTWLALKDFINLSQ